MNDFQLKFLWKKMQHWLRVGMTIKFYPIDLNLNHSTQWVCSPEGGGWPKIYRQTQPFFAFKGVLLTGCIAQWNDKKEVIPIVMLRSMTLGVLCVWSKLLFSSLSVVDCFIQSHVDASLTNTSVVLLNPLKVLLMSHKNSRFPSMSCMKEWKDLDGTEWLWILNLEWKIGTCSLSHLHYIRNLL